LLKSRRELLVCLILGAVILVAYWPVHSYEFVGFDDPELITQNPNVQGGLTLQNVWYALTATVAGNWHPVTTLSHILDCEFLGLNPGLMHLENLAFHIANTVLLLLVLTRMTGTLWRSAVVAALFALHPLRVESVAWISERKDLLSGMFFFLTLIAYVNYAKAKARVISNQLSVISNQRSTSAASSIQHPVSSIQGPSSIIHHPSFATPARRYYNLALLFFAVGLMSKPMLVTLPFLLLLLDVWPLRRVPGIASEVRGQRSEDGVESSINPLIQQSNNPSVSIHHPSSIIHHPPSLWPLVWEKWPFLFLSALSCLITLHSQSAAVYTIALRDRVANAIVSHLKYLGKTLWPTDLAILYPHTGLHYPVSHQWPAWQIGATALLLLAVSALCVYQLRRRPYLTVGWFWYLGMMVPVIGLLQVGEQAMADRYTYLPLIGPVVSLVWWIADLFKQKETKGTKESGKVQSSSFPSVEPVSSSFPSVESVPSSSFSSFPSVQILLLLVPSVVLGLATRHQLMFWQNSLALFERAAAVTADNPIIRCDLGMAYALDGHPQWAAVQYRVALAISPKYLYAHYDLATLAKDRELWDQAAEHYLAVTRLAPDFLMPRLFLVQILPKLGRTTEAIAQMDEALRIYPSTNPESPNSQMPGLMAGALNDLAWSLATNKEYRDGAQAVRFAERACEITQHQSTLMLGTLAAAYAEAGRFPDAVATAEKACAQAEQNHETVLLEKNRQLLELYRAGKPYHED
jgi:hypothetical protein